MFQDPVDIVLDSGEQSQSKVQPVSAETHRPLPSIDELMTATWQRFKERFWPLIFFAAIPLIASLLVVLLNVLMFVWSPSLIETFGIAPSAPSVSFLVLIPFGVSFFIIVFVSTWSLLSLFMIASTAVRIPMKQALSQTLGKIFPFIWLVILSAIITLGASVFVLIPGIIFSIFFTFSIFTFLLEGHRGMNALLKSREYIRGRWWKTVGYLAILVVISLIFTFIVTPLQKLVPSVAIFLRLAFNILMPAFVAVYVACLFARYKEVSSRNNSVFSPSGKQKAGYLAVGIIGLLLVGGLMFGVYSFFKDNPTYLPLLKALVKSKR